MNYFKRKNAVILRIRQMTGFMPKAASKFSNGALSQIRTPPKMPKACHRHPAQLIIAPITSNLFYCVSRAAAAAPKRRFGAPPMWEARTRETTPMTDGRAMPGISSVVALGVLLSGLAVAGAPAHAAEHEFGPEAAARSLKDFTVAQGLEVTLFASEPLVRNPTDMDIDERGRVWITEGVNYRSSFQPWGVLQPAGDRVIILEDTDGDGVADKATTFYQGPEINAALGICVLGNKAIVSSSPNVYLFTDTRGVGQADKKEILFSGIGGVDHDHGVHAFTFGPDGKLYFNFGNEGRRLKDKDGNPVLDPEGNEVNNSGKPYRMGMVFRCDPDGSHVEVLAHNFRNNYEVAVDSFGTLWQSDNDDDGNRSVRINYVMEHGNFGYSDELTGAGWQQPRSNLEPDIPHRHWHQNDPGVIPNLLLTGAGAPTGIVVYEGDLLPQIFRNQMIHADAGARVVRCYPLRPDGAGYAAQIVNILATTNLWFRPSDVCVGPDGAIYVADWNDAVVGGHNMMDRDLATMTGRVYRLAPPNFKSLVPKLDLKTAQGRAHALQSPNLATRYLAWTSLEGMGAKAETELLRLWTESTNPRLRARAFYLLARLPGRLTGYVNQALHDANSDLRITGLRAAREAGLDVIPLVRSLVHDPSAQVRRECAIALRHNPSSEAPELWASLAQQHDGHDRWYLEALGIGADRQEDKYFDAWLAAAGDHWDTPAGRDIIWRSRAAKSAAFLAAIIKDPSTPETERARYFRAYDFINGPEKKAALLSLLAAPPSAGVVSETVSRLDRADFDANPSVKAAVLTALDSVRAAADFVNIVRNFRMTGQNPALLDIAVRHPAQESGVEAMRLVLASGDLSQIHELLDSTNSAVIGAAEAIGNTREEGVAPLLLPLVTAADRDTAVRRQAVRSLSQTRQGAAGLLQLARDGKLPNDVKFTATTVLNQVRWPELRAAAAQLLPLPKGRNTEPLPPVNELLRRHANIANGAAVFARPETACMTCHRVNDKGADLGPALSEIGDKLARDAIYEAILDPSASIAFGYDAWEITLKSGNEAGGIIISETDDELTIKDAKNIATRIKKQDIATRRKLKTSLMPVGLQQTMTAQDLVDLVGYLSSLRKSANASP
jgi:putative membrane-bound dehydrogenase-like protein